MHNDHIQKLLQQPAVLKQHIIGRLYERNNQQAVFPIDGIDWQTASAVMFILGRYPHKGRFSGEPCVLLNKRSAKVRQAGDLCCPGGRVSRKLDAGLAALLRLPILHVARWPHWRHWRQDRPQQARWLQTLLATSLRESIEEMRINPFGLEFLGPLPAQPLVMFKRVIYPMVIWLPNQKRFYPNWEVEKIIYIPLRDLFNPARYARYRLHFEAPSSGPQINTFPCFRLVQENNGELLWGATYRITVLFLDYVFGFTPPDLDALPEIHGRLSRAYLSP